MRSLSGLLFSRLNSPKSQPFLIQEVLWASIYLHDAPLDSLQQFPVFLELGSPELDTALQLWPHQGRAEREDHLPQPAGHTRLYSMIVPNNHIMAKRFCFTTAQLSSFFLNPLTTPSQSTKGRKKRYM